MRRKAAGLLRKVLSKKSSAVWDLISWSLNDDDAIVRVSETQLQGSDDFLVIPVRHALMMENTDVQKETLRFLLQGRFAKKSSHSSLSEK